LYNKQAEEFLVRAPIMDGDHGHFRHILKVRFGDSAIQQPLTQVIDFPSSDSLPKLALKDAKD